MDPEKKSYHTLGGALSILCTHWAHILYTAGKINHHKIVFQ